jgi:8-oxo-dGTP diphosphatase
MTEEDPSKAKECNHHADTEYRFCPLCGHTLQTQVIKSFEPERLVCSDCGYVFYLNPKVAVGTLGTLNGKIVLLKRGIEPAYGRWVFPGGYVDRGETLEEAAIRETQEEVNLEIRIESLVNVYSYPGRPVIVVVYAVEIIGGELGAGEEAIEVRTFAPGEIPWRELAFPSTRDALREYIKKYLDPSS